MEYSYTVYRGEGLDYDSIREYIPIGIEEHKISIRGSLHRKGHALIEIVVRLPEKEYKRRKAFIEAIRAIELKGKVWSPSNDITPEPPNYGLSIGRDINSFFNIERLPNNRCRWKLKAEAVYNYIQKRSKSV